VAGGELVPGLVSQAIDGRVNALRQTFELRWSLIVVTSVQSLPLRLTKL